VQSTIPYLLPILTHWIYFIVQNRAKISKHFIGKYIYQFLWSCIKEI